VHREGPRSAGKDQRAVQVPASACRLHEGHERSVGVGWGGDGSQTRVGDGAGQPCSDHDVTARQALCGLTKPGQEVCAIPAWRDQRVRRVEVEPPVHQGLLQGDARGERSVRISGGDHGLWRWDGCGELASARIQGLRGREDVELGGLQLVQDRPERTQAVLGRPGHAGRPCGEAGPRRAEQNNACPGIVPTGLEELRLSSALLSCMTGKVCLCKSARAAQLLCRSGPH
jgi:hypothetical protein